MTVVASSIVNRVRQQLIDNGSTQRWSDTELLYWLSDGQRTVVSMNPTASATLATMALVAGTRQSLPSAAFKLLNVYRNLTAGGVSGVSCLFVPRELLDTQYPSWHTASTATSAVTHWTYDEIDPLAFYVYPRNDGTGSVEINYSANPTDVASTSANISVRDIYSNALFDYVMYRAHSKDGDYAGGQALATQYFQSFSAFMSLHSKGA